MSDHHGHDLFLLARLAGFCALTVFDKMGVALRSSGVVPGGVGGGYTAQELDLRG
jgi:hypothetical protein